MAEDNRRTHASADEHHHRTGNQDPPHPASSEQPVLEAPPDYPLSLLGSPALDGRGNEPVRIAMVQRLQQTYGNRAVQRFLHGHSHSPADGTGAAHAPGPGTRSPDLQRQAIDDVTEDIEEDREDAGEPDIDAAGAPGAGSLQRAFAGESRVQRVPASEKPAQSRPRYAVQRLMSRDAFRKLTKASVGSRGKTNPVLLKIDDLLAEYASATNTVDKKRILDNLSIVNDWLEKRRGKSERTTAMETLKRDIEATYKAENIPLPDEGHPITPDTTTHPTLTPQSAFAPDLQIDAAEATKRYQAIASGQGGFVILQLKNYISQLLGIDKDPARALTGTTIDAPMKAAILQLKAQYNLANPNDDAVNQQLVNDIETVRKRNVVNERQKGRDVATQELQNKLNSALNLNPPLTSGVFDADTENAVTLFKQRFNLPNPNVTTTDNDFWRALDARGTSDVGQASIISKENLGGQDAGGTGNFTWKITASAFEVSIKISFDMALGADASRRGAVVQGCKQAIDNIWNGRFQIVKSGGNPALDLVFQVQDLQDQTGADINRVVLTPGDGRSDQGNWYFDDPDLYKSTAAHEFGHMLGLEDEYQRSHADYKRIVGASPVEGASKLNAAKADACATALHTALSVAPANNPTRQQATDAYQNALLVLKKNDLLNTDSTGAKVVEAYRRLYNEDLVDRIGQIKGAFGKSPESVMLKAGSLNINADSAHSRLVEPFTFESQSLMGAGGNVGQHTHGVEPRHVRHFVDYVRANKGGAWEAKRK